MKFKVFNVEFDGMDKVGKDSIMHQIFSISPNKYIPKARGLLSQIAYADLYNRDFDYEVPQGYLDCTLFVYLTVDEADWNVRCDLTNEHANNKNRCDIDREATYKESVKSFDYAYEELERLGTDKSHLMTFNTTKYTPYMIIKEVVKRLEELNRED